MLAALRVMGVVAWRGGAWDDWDLATRGGFMGEARLRIAVEEHGGGRQLLRTRAWIRIPAGALAVTAALSALGGAALAGGARGVAAVLLAAAAATLGIAATHAARALAALEAARPALESEAAKALLAVDVAPQAEAPAPVAARAGAAPAPADIADGVVAAPSSGGSREAASLTGSVETAPVAVGAEDRS